jgi:hypothetical protein
MKHCRECGGTYPLEMFYATQPTYCIPCHKARSRANYQANKARSHAQSAAWAAANPERRKEITRKTKYGVTPSWWEATLAAQGGGCWVCESTEKLCVDHEHGGSARGILCSACNTALGMMAESPTRIRQLAYYIEFKG